MINIDGVVNIQIEIFDNNNKKYNLVMWEELTGEYEDLEVKSKKEVLEDIEGAVTNYYKNISCQGLRKNNGEWNENKTSYVQELEERFDRVYSEDADIRIEILKIEANIKSYRVDYCVHEGTEKEYCCFGCDFINECKLEDRCEINRYECDKLSI